ncbi:hypothetical protein AVEN_225861-1 [Araneus ventricosus]|uniref:Uncharacterized protein n=1 Tax=Araneus ventricosus TaxID=182803 RepID=A0A4Y2BC35_ARAVE|nr:hypothetical protein AVEN_225861-1 [Araneus ventricosus]
MSTSRKNKVNCFVQGYKENKISNPFRQFSYYVIRVGAMRMKEKVPDDSVSSSVARIVVVVAEGHTDLAYPKGCNAFKKSAEKRIETLERKAI